MFKASFIPAAGGAERTLTAQTEAELRVELRTVTHAGAIANGRAVGPDGQMIAEWRSGATNWIRPDGEPWGVE
jgi:hypothetical protein